AVASLLDRERASAGDYERSVPAADRLAPKQREAIPGPIRADRGLVITAVAMRSAKIRPVRAPRIFVHALGVGFGGGFHYRRVALPGAAAFEPRILRLPAAEHGDRAHTAAIPLETESEKQHQISDRP